MTWYTKYLSVFEKPYDTIPQTTKSEIREKLKHFTCTDPLVSVVIIAHNEEQHLWACLWSLSENKSDFPTEIIGVNNNSTDNTCNIFQESGIRWFNETQKGPGHARQCGLNQARGKYYICIDADTLYPPRYIQTMIRHLKKSDTVGAYGLWSFIPDAQHPKSGLLIYEFLRDIHLRIQSLKRPEFCVRGMVFGFVTEYGRKVGFRTDIRRGEDGSLALGLKEFGRLKFVTSRKARPITSTSTLSADGSLLDSFKIRAVKFIKGLSGYFTSKKTYKDEKSNML